jgi:hypothetical protein
MTQLSINSQISQSELQLSRFIRDLLDIDEQLIKQGNDNFEREDFTLNYVVVAEVNAIPISIPKTYDGTAESMKYGALMSASMTIDFFGVDANTRKNLFILLANSQKGYELQRDMQLTVSNPSTVTNLKQLTGTQYSPRFQLAVNIRYNETTDVNTLRIDTAETEITFDP